MTLENIYYISQVIAVVAIVASLIFVGVQLREQIVEARLAAIREATFELNQIYQGVQTDPGLAEVMAKFFLSGYANLTLAETLRVDANVSQYTGFWQSVYLQRNQGRLDDALWLHIDMTMQSFFVTEGGKAFWEKFPSRYTSEFRAYVDGTQRPEITPYLSNNSPLTVDKPEGKNENSNGGTIGSNTKPVAARD